MAEAVRIVVPFIRYRDRKAAYQVKRAGRLEPERWRVIREDCLRPWLLTDDAVMIDFDRAPADGDLVLVEARYRRAGAILLGDASIVTIEAIKQLRIVNGEQFLCCSEGAVSAAAHRIVGVVVAWHRPGWWRRPSPRRMRFQVPRTISVAV
ncbi:MAG: hypothetical protein ACT4UQ_09305 [Gammaproteobacteria bacterium]